MSLRADSRTFRIVGATLATFALVLTGASAPAMAVPTAHEITAVWPAPCYS